MSQEYYAYLHVKPNGVPFYVGKGNYHRAHKVLKRYNSIHTRTVEKYGADNIKVITYPCDSEQQAFELEHELVILLRDYTGIKLANFSDGGEGNSGYKNTPENIKARITPESRKKAAETLRKRLALGEIKTGCPENFAHSEEAKAKIAEAARQMHANRTED
jgi:hypothetical protein